MKCSSSKTNPRGDAREMREGQSIKSMGSYIYIFARQGCINRLMPNAIHSFSETAKLGKGCSSHKLIYEEQFVININDCFEIFICIWGDSN